MRALTVIPKRAERRTPKGTNPSETWQGKLNDTPSPQLPSLMSLQRHPRPHTHHKIGGRLAKHIRRAFTPLIDAKAASQLLGVPYT
jgi:hypothetical protein